MPNTKRVAMAILFFPLVNQPRYWLAKFLCVGTVLLVALYLAGAADTRVIYYGAKPERLAFNNATATASANLTIVHLSCQAPELTHNKSYRKRYRCVNNSVTGPDKGRRFLSWNNRPCTMRCRTIFGFAQSSGLQFDSNL